jgi:hypothetical protein
LKKKIKYEIGSQVKWTADINCVKVYNGNTDQIRILHYPEAALWDLILQQYSTATLISMMAAITNKNEAETEKWINRTLDDWSGLNLLKQ